jgi:hypothetical protein
MKTFCRFATLITALAVASACAYGGETNVLPGVVFCDGPEALPGRLLFVYARNCQNLGTSTVPATVYSLDLKTKQLRSLVQTPPLSRIHAIEVIVTI